LTEVITLFISASVIGIMFIVGKLPGNESFNTMRKDDADLRFYITTVQDG